MKIFRKKQGITRKISPSYKVTNYLTNKTSKNISCAISKAKNHSEITKTNESDRVYYILKGKLLITVDNKKIKINEGDMIFIPKNTEYQFGGTFKAVLINSPAFKKS